MQRDLSFRQWRWFRNGDLIRSDTALDSGVQHKKGIAHKLGVRLTTTSSYSPHQNGLNERNHATVDLMITRMVASDEKMSPEMALSWALNAKNCLDNCHGFSPFQLHIGKNPLLPWSCETARLHSRMKPRVKVSPHISML